MDISQEEFEGRKKVCDERFARDKELLAAMTKAAETSSLTMASVNQLLASQATTLTDHETRLRAQESRRGDLSDNITKIVLGAIIGGIIAFLLKSAGIG